LRKGGVEWLAEGRCIECRHFWWSALFSARAMSWGVEGTRSEKKTLDGGPSHNMANDQLLNKMGDRINLSDLSTSVLDNISKPAAAASLPAQLDCSFIREYSNFLARNEQTEEMMRRRVVMVWEAAMKTYGYRCIKEATFLHPRIPGIPLYSTCLNLRRSSTRRMPFLDVGTCFGNDIRKLILDGYPREEIAGLDVEPAFWEYGKQVFDDELDGIEYLCGNILDDAFLSSGRVPSNDHGNAVPFPVTRNYKPANINHLKSHFEFAHVGSVLHLLNQTDIPHFLTKLLLLLAPNGYVFGRTCGAIEPVRLRGGVLPCSAQLGYIHSQSSLAEVLRECGFENVVVEIQDGQDAGRVAEMQPIGTHGMQLLFLVFSAQRPSLPTTLIDK